MRAAFGNDPAKVNRYHDFWNRRHARRPLTGFSLTGWFPSREFAALRRLPQESFLEPSQIQPSEFLADHFRLLKEGEIIEDDLIRGACPAQGAIPWSAGFLGCRIRLLPDTLLGEERCLSWEQAIQVRLDRTNAWWQKYLEFAHALVVSSQGTFPVSHSPELGPSDLFALLRGHTQSILDLHDEPAHAERLLWRLAEFFEDFTRSLWSHLPRFAGGWFDAQYSLWAPGPIARLQEDASANYSPALYRRYLLPIDRKLAAAFSHSFMHLHSTSMHLLDAFLEIEQLRCFQINLDVAGPPLERMVGYFQRVQAANRALVIRGSMQPSELSWLLDRLECRGLFLLLMVDSLTAVEQLRRCVGL